MNPNPVPATGDTPARTPAWHQVLLGVSLLAMLALYLPATHGPWLHDDLPNIVMNSSVQADTITAQTLAASTAKYPSRPLAMMSFSVNHALCGLSTTCYKETNVGLHLLTGLALFAFLRVLRRAAAARGLPEIPDWLPAVVTSLWLLHPLQVSTTLYVVQRMTQIATLGSFTALALYLYGRFLAANGRTRGLAYAGALVAVLVGLAGKENVLLVVPYALVTELFLLDERTRARLRRPALTVAIVGGTALALAAALLLGWKWIEATYTTRDYSPGARLLTEARMLSHYVGNILWPDFRNMPFYLDAMPTSTSLFTPWTTLPAVALWIALPAGALAVLWRRPSLVAFGILFFIAGHLIESTLLGLVLGYEHRNYGPSAGILVAAVTLIAAVVTPSRMKAVSMALVVLLVAALLPRVQAWSSEPSYTAFLDRYAADSYAAQNYIGHYYILLQDDEGGADIDGDYETLAREHLMRSVRLSSQPFNSLVTMLLRPAPDDARERQWQEMLRVARESTPNADMMTSTQTLVVCFVFTECPVPKARFSSWLETMLANPRLRGSVRINVERMAGTYYVRATTNKARGLELSRQAAATGDAMARESLIKNLAFAGQTAEARALYQAWQAQQPLGANRRQRIEDALAGVTTPRP